MAGWDGIGNFTVNYFFVQDAAAGVKILAAKQDTQWATVVAGLMNCQTRDGQNKPSANWDFNGFKLTNLGAPSAATDVARLGDLPTGLNEWIAESNSFTWVSGTQLRINGVDVSATYKIGRRLKITHNAGITVSYAIITVSNFGGGNTNLTVHIDTLQSAVLISPLTGLSYSLISFGDSFTGDSLPWNEAIEVNSTNSTNVVSGVGEAFPSSNSIFTIATRNNDLLNDYNIVSGAFTCRRPGMYLLGGYLAMTRNAAIWSSAGTMTVSNVTAGVSRTQTFLATSNQNFYAQFQSILYANAQDNLTVSYVAPAFSFGPATTAGAAAYFARVS